MRVAVLTEITQETFPVTEVEDAANGILENGMYLPNQDPAKVAKDVVEATAPILGFP